MEVKHVDFIKVISGLIVGGVVGAVAGGFTEPVVSQLSAEAMTLLGAIGGVLLGSKEDDE